MRTSLEESSKSCAFVMGADRGSRSPTTNLIVGESRRVPASGPLAQASDPDGSGPQGANHGWLAFFARQDVESKNPGWFTTRPQAIDTRPRQRPFLEGAPEAWPRGRHSPALSAQRIPAMPKASPIHPNTYKKRPPIGRSAAYPGRSLRPGRRAGKARGAYCWYAKVGSEDQKS